MLFSKNSTNVFFHILTKCNLNCRHCYINTEQHGENTLPISTIEAWLGAFAEKSKTANVIFLGGEPTIHPDLSFAIKKAKNMGYSSITVDFRASSLPRAIFDASTNVNAIDSSSCSG